MDSENKKLLDDIAARLRKTANDNMSNIELGHLLMLAADKIEEFSWPSVDPSGVEKRTARVCMEIAKVYDGRYSGPGHNIAHSIEKRFGLEEENW